MSEKTVFDPNNPCLFCHPKPEEIIEETEHALLITDSFPVSKGHCLIVPRRHIRLSLIVQKKKIVSFTT